MAASMGMQVNFYIYTAVFCLIITKIGITILSPTSVKDILKFSKANSEWPPPWGACIFCIYAAIYSLIITKIGIAIVSPMVSVKDILKVLESNSKWLPPTDLLFSGANSD